MATVHAPVRLDLQPTHEEIAVRGKNTFEMADHVGAEVLAEVFRCQPKNRRQLV